MSFTAPDWRVESNYVDPKIELNLSYWAWEFLRRSPAYGASWAEFVANLRKLVPRLPDVENYINHIIDGTPAAASIEQGEAFYEQTADAPELLHFSPEKSSGETFEEWTVRASGLDAPMSITPLDQFLAEKHNLDKLVNPALGYWANGFPRMRFRNSGLVVKQVVSGGASVRRASLSDTFYGNQMTIAFDLDSPDSVLVAQLQTALVAQRQRVRSEVEPKDEAARPNGSLPLFRTYLRTLDARAAGIKHSVIGAAIVPHKTLKQQDADARNWENRALVLRDSLCIEMPAYEVIAVKKK